MPDTIRIGLIGTSWWADMAHLPFIKNESRATLAAICGRNRTRAQEMADKYGVSAVYTDYREMLAQAELDAVVVSTPDDTHFPMTMAALDAGLHVLCEKPLATNATEARTMLDKAEAKGVRHLVFHTWRWQPHYRYMRSMIDQGAIGRLLHAEFRYLMGGGPSTEYSWRFDRAHGLGVIGDSGAHMFDLARYFCGDIAQVSADIVCTSERRRADGAAYEQIGDAASVQIEFADGARGLVNMSMAARTEDPFFEQTVELHGETGSLLTSLRPVGGFWLKYSRAGSGAFETLTLPTEYLSGIDPAQPYFASFASLFAQQPIGIRLFVDSIVSGKTAEPNFHDGLKTQQVIDAALASAQHRRWVAVNPG